MHLPACARGCPVNADQWGAIAALGGLAVVLGGVLGTVAVALLRTRFVTRSEHNFSQEGMSKRIKDVETGLAGKVGKEELTALNTRLYTAEQELGKTNVKLAETNGLLKSNTDAAQALGRQIDLLIQNELSREKI